MKAHELSELARSAKPCPFCGGRARLEPMPNASHWWRVRCTDFHCGGTTWAMQGPELAAAAWNRRPDGPQ